MTLLLRNTEREYQILNKAGHETSNNSTMAAKMDTLPQVKSNTSRKGNEGKTLETDREILSRFNVTPDVYWLKKFFNVGSVAKRKSLFDFPFIINGKNICTKTPDPFLLIMVLSVHSHIDTREAIRNTWGRSAYPGVWPKVGVLPEKVKLVFLFGRGKTGLMNTIVKDESRTYNDIIQADFKDSYFNLTYKVITGIRWVAQFCPGAKYILKADEDVFVHVHNLLDMLKNAPQTETATFYGHTQERASVLRTGRWNVAPKLFPFPVYPTYTCGNTYIVPGSTARQIFNMARFLDYMNIEDVFVTGILRTLIKAEIKDVVGFTNWYEKKPLPCEFKNSIRISATRVTGDMQYDIWEGLKSNVRNCYKLMKKKENLNRPERVLVSRNVIMDEHIFFNKTSKQFYSIG